MPVGASKLGVLGAGLVPGGSVTFNAPGTWPIPPGVKKVSITGRGGTGNPGNAGNPGNPGNPGSGGSGGSGGQGLRVAPTPFTTSTGNTGAGGSAWKISNQGRNGQLFFPTNFNVLNPPGTCFAFRGGALAPSQGGPPGCGQAGQSGNAGQAGQAGNPGNSGQPSSGLGNTFPGGAGGNAGVAGAAGNGGTGGPGGGKGGDGPPNTTASPGSAGSGGGAGGGGCRQTAPPGGFPFPGSSTFAWGGNGGGGAGAVNSGAAGQTGVPCTNANAAVGGTGNVTAPLGNPTSYPNKLPGLSNSTQGGYGGFIPTAINGRASVNALLTDASDANLFLRGAGGCGANFVATQTNRNSINQFSPGPTAPETFRSGGGGGAGASVCGGPTGTIISSGAGGGGGARGNAGNAGGVSPTPTGAAGTPQTFNCVTVTPGATVPITVGSPGGQIVISWNPQ